MEDDSPSLGPASAIKAIDKRSVHRICSGQVVLTLATAVKELVENSIDAGATSIEVRLKDYGAELIEVVDNGCGVEEENFEGLTLKHHTSKLRDFDDLVNVETFGFRGEALSSLCALSTLSVTTCHKDTSVATRLEFNTNGQLVTKTPTARQTGTTICLGQLFHTLPVRHKEFQRNIKKEFNKMVHVLNAYCLISTGIRITCTNQAGKGKKSVIVSTNGNETIKENITNIFGPKQFQSLLTFNQILPSEQICNEYNIKMPEAKVFSVSGYVSSSEHGQGRGSSDRQFIFINRRPCDLSKVTRVVNDAYHSYNRHQFPFVVLDISLAKDSVDVNVTPDKRQIFISEEKLLLATIKMSLIEMFEPISSVYQTNQGQGKLAASLTASFSRGPQSAASQSPLKKSASEPSSSKKNTLTSTLASLKRSFSSAFSKEDNSIDFNTSLQQPNKQRKLDGFIRVERNSSKNDESNDDSLSLTKISSLSTNLVCTKMGVMTPPSMTDTESCGLSQTSSSTDELHAGVQPHGDVTTLPSDVTTHSHDITIGPSDGTLNFGISESPPRDIPKPSMTHRDTTLMCESIEDSVLPSERGSLQNSPVYKLQPVEHLKEEADVVLKPECSNGGGDDSIIPAPTVIYHTPTQYDEATPVPVSRQSAVIPFCMSSLKSRLKRKQTEAESKERYRSFRARISPSDNQAAEDELKKEIKKEMFVKMQILGQFNLGFIITRLGSDLFIVDQHATDEKYNFEQLQQHTVIRSQKLIQPQGLELTAANSCVLIDNMDVFRTNGFDFIIDEEAPITSRVKLTAMPVSKNWTFGKDVIEELIFMLTDSPGVLCRPSRVRMMFASRACRKSIMVGTALNTAEMRKLINHMAEIEQPWNCPHGRPTMRHLINLDCLEDLGK